MKEFDFFLEKGDVKKQKPDRNTAKATLRECIDRLALAKNLLKNSKPKYVLENAYESMREAADAILYQEGFKSFSHEGSIVYLLKKGFSESDINELDRLRKIRNSIKYYGGTADETDARSALTLAEKVIERIKKLFDDEKE